MPRITNIEYMPISGDWGAQIGWLSARLPAAFTDMILNGVPVFRQRPAAITFGMPLAPGELPGSRYSCITFDTDRHRQRFLAALEEALRAAHPELFAPELGK